MRSPQRNKIADRRLFLFYEQQILPVFFLPVLNIRLKKSRILFIISTIDSKDLAKKKLTEDDTLLLTSDTQYGQ